VGDGKTTILHQLHEQLEAEGVFVAYGEANDLLDLEDVEHEDVLLSLLALVDKALRQRYRADLDDGVPVPRRWPGPGGRP
jgi:HEAT repeat protein